MIAQIPKVVEAGYVSVIARDGIICGIVTPADLIEHFSALTRPFFMLSEIERRLRRVIDRTFDEGDLNCVASPEEDRRTIPSSADELTMGQAQRLLDNQELWDKLNWKPERPVFIDALNEVREIRNEVMHFRPNPLSDNSTIRLDRFARWLRSLHPDRY
ncbi:hypothetical protein [Haloactinomyces albus]|uniref:CBS domain-containing protein n=1 Tax=Haloactinomyces albus TaxID=1352928 RepID=A0AAE4CNP0_9ACTN|nr:hypothetical protein [Haloactinomyces albus]MDR7300868.1 hypothetical protein [Haloactinomyces albus]